MNIVKLVPRNIMQLQLITAISTCKFTQLFRLTNIAMSKERTHIQYGCSVGLLDYGKNHNLAYFLSISNTIIGGRYNQSFILQFESF